MRKKTGKGHITRPLRGMRRAERAEEGREGRHGYRRRGSCDVREYKGETTREGAEKKDDGGGVAPMISAVGHYGQPKKPNRSIQCRETIRGIAESD